jgi:hypothetical protein
LQPYFTPTFLRSLPLRSLPLRSFTPSLSLCAALVLSACGGGGSSGTLGGANLATPAATTPAAPNVASTTGLQPLDVATVAAPSNPAEVPTPPPEPTPVATPLAPLAQPILPIDSPPSAELPPVNTPVAPAAAIDKVKLLQFVHLNAKLYGMGFAALHLADDSSTLRDPNTFCTSGAVLSSSFNSEAITPGVQQLSGNLLAELENCNSRFEPGLTYTGTSNVTYSYARASADVKQLAGSAQEKLRTTQKNAAGVAEDITIEGERFFNFSKAAGLGEVAEVSSITYSPGVVLIDHKRELTATVNANSTSVRAMNNNGSMEVSYDMRMSIAGVPYTAAGSYQYGSSSRISATSGEVILSSNGVRLGRIFVDSQKRAVLIEVDGVVTPLENI